MTEHDWFIIPALIVINGLHILLAWLNLTRE